MTRFWVVWCRFCMVYAHRLQIAPRVNFWIRRSPSWGGRFQRGFWDQSGGWDFWIRQEPTTLGEPTVPDRPGTAARWNIPPLVRPNSRMFGIGVLHYRNLELSSGCLTSFRAACRTLNLNMSKYTLLMYRLRTAALNLSNTGYKHLLWAKILIIKSERY